MGFMTRNGKIARLPRAIRDELSRRLQDGEPGKHLVQWLNWNPSPKHWDVPALHHLSAILSPVCHPPRALRDGLNRRMDDGQTGTELLPWLNGSPEVKNSWPNTSPDAPSANKTSPNGRPACRAVASWRRTACRAVASWRRPVAIAFGSPGGKRSPRPADDGAFRPGLNHENYQTNPNANIDFTQ